MLQEEISGLEYLRIGLNLSFIGSINDNILEMTEVAGEFISFLKDNYCNILAERYMIKDVDDVFQIMEDIAIAKKCVKKGGEPDIEKACILLLDDFRSGKLGRISLETPQED